MVLRCEMLGLGFVRSRCPCGCAACSAGCASTERLCSRLDAWM